MTTSTVASGGPVTVTSISVVVLNQWDREWDRERDLEKLGLVGERRRGLERRIID
jgi:hypothetical protein